MVSSPDAPTSTNKAGRSVQTWPLHEQNSIDATIIFRIICNLSVFPCIYQYHIRDYRTNTSFKLNLRKKEITRINVPHTTFPAGVTSPSSLQLTYIIDEKQFQMMINFWQTKVIMRGCTSYCKQRLPQLWFLWS